MGWTKLGFLAMLLVIIGSVSAFGGHFGWTVEGIPQKTDTQSYSGSGAYGLPAGEYTGDDLYKMGYSGWAEGDMTVRIVISEGEAHAAKGGLLDNSLSYYTDLITFRVDGVPELLAFVFLVFNILAAYCLVTAFLPGGGG